MSTPSHIGARAPEQSPRTPRLRIVRVAGYVLCLGVLSLAGLRLGIPAHAQGLLALGEALPAPDYLPLGLTQLTINGASFELHNARTTRTVSTVLDGFSALCGMSAPSVRDALVSDGRAPALPAAHDVQVARLDPTPAEGIASCFANSDAHPGNSMIERARSFLRTQRLDDLGRVRLVIARRSGDSTHVMHLWSDGAIDLRTMFPASAHAPGRDTVPGIAHDSVRRELAFEEKSGAYAFSSYSSAEPLENVIAHVDTRMKQAGFRAVNAPRGWTIPDGLRGYQDGRELIVMGARVQHGKSMVGLVRMGHTSPRTMETSP